MLRRTATAVESRAGVRVARTDRAGRITLDRPERINALTLAMVREIDATLARWAEDPAIRTVVIDGAGTRGFCAGGDLRDLIASSRGDGSHARTFWAEEYRLDAAIARYPKPIVVAMSGIVMGGGLGIGAFARVRVVTETTRIAMPECNIGLVPDVGATWLFSRMPGETGTYLALTGAAIGAADAIALGLADWCLPNAWLEPFALAALGEIPGSGGDVEAIARAFSRDPGEATLVRARREIDAAFAHDDVRAILAALRANPSDFARETLARIETKSPTSLALALRALREARTLRSLEACLALEYRMMTRLLGSHDFREGVRAAVVEKDRAPAWLPATLDKLESRTLEAYFAPGASGEWAARA